LKKKTIRGSQNTMQESLLFPVDQCTHITRVSTVQYCKHDLWYTSPEKFHLPHLPKSKTEDFIEPFETFYTMKQHLFQFFMFCQWPWTEDHN
jgi:hypothetical protein